MEKGIVHQLIEELASVEPLNESDKEQAIKIGTVEDSVVVDAKLTTETESAPVIKAEEEVSQDIRQIISAASIPQRIKLAMFGNGAARSILIRDANRIIQQCVLKNPRLSDREVEEFARNTNISEFVLRSFSNSPQWIKSYAVKYALVTNPKTPGDIALKWLRYINLPDLKKLAKSKQISQLVSTTARKRVVELEKH